LATLAVAARLAREQEAELLLLSVCHVADGTAEAARDELARRLADAAVCQCLEGLPVKTRVEMTEDPPTAITRVVEEEEIDLLVMTPHEFSDLSLRHSSVAETLRPVTVVHAVSESGGRPEVSETNPDAPATTVQSGSAPGRLRLRLLGAFGLSAGSESVALNRGTRRLLAFVALQGHLVSRAVVAEALWPEAPEDSSHASLRSAIWRLEPAAREVMSINVAAIDLSPAVAVDLVDAKVLAHRIERVGTLPPEEDMMPAAIATLSSDLLPEWHDEWAIIEAEDWRKLRLHALEALAQKLLDAGRESEALDVATGAKKADPLRETPRALIIRTYLAEGNQSDAVREFLAYRDLLRKELGISPTVHLRELMRGLS